MHPSRNQLKLSNRLQHLRLSSSSISFSHSIFTKTQSLRNPKMKSFSICTVTAILAAAFSHAAPLEVESRQFRVQVIFQGAPPEVAYYTRSIPSDGSVFYLSRSTRSSTSLPLSIPFLQHRSPLPLMPNLIFSSLKTSFLPNLLYPDNVLSISHIKSLGGATCTFFGIDGSKTTVVGAQTVDVGPPQTQISAVCRAL